MKAAENGRADDIVALLAEGANIDHKHPDVRTRVEVSIFSSHV
jgi:hypothetical protein